MKNKEKNYIKFTEITYINLYGKSFDWLADEPDIYTRKDVKKSKTC